MKRTLQILFLATFVCISANGREISGQVFIVTKAHESVKLGLVSISIYSRDQVLAVKEAVDSELKSDREETANLASSLNQAYQAASQAGDRLWKDAMASSPRDTNLFKAV